MSCNATATIRVHIPITQLLLPLLIGIRTLLGRPVAPALVTLALAPRVHMSSYLLQQ